MKLVLLVFCCVVSFGAMAQLKATTLKGYIAVEGGESFTYQLVFSDSGGVIKGYSLTYKEEKNEVKSSITGAIDERQKN